MKMTDEELKTYHVLLSKLNKPDLSSTNTRYYIEDIKLFLLAIQYDRFNDSLNINK